eukprot:GHVU01017639.1.p1 GENE.GHVU01017639.1~~GHVU01017639.1.p1  ORF type:complete len:387 (+),score=63.68 GHVU01017639.1:223-1383(+)
MWLVAACVRGCLRTCRCARVCAAVCVRACVPRRVRFLRVCADAAVAAVTAVAARTAVVAGADGGTAAATAGAQAAAVVAPCDAGADAASASGGAATAAADGIGGAASAAAAADASAGASAAGAAAALDGGDEAETHMQHMGDLEDEVANDLEEAEAQDDADDAANVRKKRVVFDWGAPIRTFTLTTWESNRAAAKKVIQDSREGSFRWAGASTSGEQESVRYRCRAHETPEGQPCGAWMMHKGAPPGPVFLHAMGAHASVRVPDACGLGYEFKAEVQSKRGPLKAPARKVANMLELDVEHQVLDADSAPTLAAVKNFLKTVRRRERGGHNAELMLAEVNEWAAQHAAPTTAADFELLPPLQVVVFKNAMDVGLGVVFGNRAVGVQR